MQGALSSARVIRHNGSPDQHLINECGLTSADRLRGQAYLYVRFEFSTTVFPLGVPNVSAVVRGKKVLDPSTGRTAWTDNAALCVCEYLKTECDLDDQPAGGDAEVTTTLGHSSFAERMKRRDAVVHGWDLDEVVDRKCPLVFAVVAGVCMLAVLIPFMTIGGAGTGQGV
jgi:hypothetical protein